MIDEEPRVKTIKHNEIEGLYTYHPDKFEDHRGLNFEIHQHNDYPIFELDSCSMSKKDVLRGFHGDQVNWKLIQCLHGKIQFFAIDMREESKTYLNFKEFILDSKEPVQVLVPARVVNAHLCLSDECTFFYKWSKGYVPIGQQIHVKWNDPRFNLNWKTQKPILSDRDK